MKKIAMFKAVGIDGKKIIALSFLFVLTFLLSGCSLNTALVSTKDLMANATVIKTDDAGSTWNPKIKVDDKKTIASVDVLSMVINPNDSNIVYIGTVADGLFVTKDAGETWSQVAFPEKAYGLVIDPNNPDIMYASGVLNGRAKIFKRLAEGQEWKEIYTEPANGTTISSIAIDRTNSRVLYAGTSEGVIIKTTDAGVSWTNIKKAEGPIIGIGFDNSNASHVFFGVFQTGVLETKNAGATVEDITEKVDTANHNRSVYTLVADPYLSGVVYVGTEAGIFKKSGETWVPMNMIESSKVFPVRAIAVNPKNSKEIMYSSAKAIYKSVDSGTTWSTFQLNTSKELSTIKYDPMDPSKIYAGLRGY
jgi:photosystem II stability/assembly factor-like uncharacterized protein